MDCSTQNSILHQASSEYSDFKMVYSIIGAIFLAVLVRNLISKPKPYKLFPVWATIEIALASYFLRGNGLGRRIFSSIRKYSGSLFGITSTHQVLVDLPGVDRLMSQSFHSLNAEPVQYTLFTRVFGGIDSLDLKKKLESSWRDLLTPIERLFLNEAAAAAAIERACIPQQAASFLTFSSDPKLMQRWEMSAGVRIVEPSLPNKPGRAEANLQSLTRDFGACMAIPLLYGKDFLDRYPQLLDDFWKFDNDLFPLLMIGIPSWAPFKTVKEGLLARSRILVALEALYRRIDQYQRGGCVDFGADMSDVDRAIFERNEVYEREGWSYAERAAGDFAIFWGQNANTQPVLFWFLTYIYSTAGLPDRVRAETAPYIALSEGATPEIISMDLDGLSRNCQLLRACIFETYRMANEPTSIRYITRPITITDGELQHKLKAGMFISAPHSLINSDPLIYADPDKFIPDRFLEPDSRSGKPVARYGRLRRWGTGVSMCKGRTFAEKEIVSVGAAIISLWDIKPASGTWKLPAMMPGTGVKKPINDIRVVITRRRCAGTE
ncbi:Fc.00g027350.m01.CDS01 [Cosmosporella sp. VM-42]